MKKEHLDKNIEDKLDRFLAENAPLPPAPKPGEKDKILRTISIITPSQPQKESFFKKNLFTPLKWMVPIAAAAMIGFITLTTYLPQPTESITDEKLSAYIEETFETIYTDNEYDSADEQEYASAGDPWLYLAEAVSQSR